MGILDLLARRQTDLLRALPPNSDLHKDRLSGAPVAAYSDVTLPFPTRPCATCAPPGLAFERETSPGQLHELWPYRRTCERDGAEAQDGAVQAAFSAPIWLFREGFALEHLHEIL